MSEIVWSQALDVGVEEMNQEHKELIQIMNQLWAKNSRGAAKAELLELFDRLIEYTHHHFSDEENFLKEKGHPSLREHSQIHRGLIEALSRHRQEFKTSVTGKIPSAVFDFFKTWLTTHIMIVDKTYSPSKS